MHIVIAIPLGVLLTVAVVALLMFDVARRRAAERARQRKVRRDARFAAFKERFGAPFRRRAAAPQAQWRDLRSPDTPHLTLEMLQEPPPPVKERRRLLPFRRKG